MTHTTLDIERDLFIFININELKLYMKEKIFILKAISNDTVTKIKIFIGKAKNKVNIIYP